MISLLHFDRFRSFSKFQNVEKDASFSECYVILVFIQKVSRTLATIDRWSGISVARFTTFLGSEPWPSQTASIKAKP